MAVTNCPMFSGSFPLRSPVRPWLALATPRKSPEQLLTSREVEIGWRTAVETSRQIELAPQIRIYIRRTLFGKVFPVAVGHVITLFEKGLY